MMKQHQHGGASVGGNNTVAGAAVNGGGSGSGAGIGPAESHSVHAGVNAGAVLSSRDCWSTHQGAPASHQHDGQVPLQSRRTLDDEASPARRDVLDDDDDEPTKKPLHLLQLQTAMHRFSPPEHGPGHHSGPPKSGGGSMPSYRASPTSLHPVPAARYHHTTHGGTTMASPIHAWPDPATVDMLPAGLQHPHAQQQQRLHASNQPSPYPSSATYMTDMTTSTYHHQGAWYAGGTTQQMHQTPAHHLSTLLS